jgi:hypothetical protein
MDAEEEQCAQQCSVNCHMPSAVPPRLALAACLGVIVALVLALAQAMHMRHFFYRRRPALSARRREALLVVSSSSPCRRLLASDLHTASLPNTRDLAAYLPIRRGLVYRTASPLGDPARVAALVEALGVGVLVDLRSRAEWGAADDAAAAALDATVHRLPARPDRRGRDALVSLATHWHRWWRRGSECERGWHPPPADPPLEAAPFTASTSPRPRLAILHAPVQAWAPYLRAFVLAHVLPLDGLAVLAAYAGARLAGRRPPVPAVRARLEAATAAAGLPAMYCTLLDAFAPEIVGAVRAVGAALAATTTATASPPSAVAVACKLGKDRTGLAVALVGLAAGAPETAVLADYAASAAREGDSSGHGPSSLAPLSSGFSALAGAPPAALAAALDHLDATHGGWARYLEVHGFSVADQAALAAVLRE